MYGQKQSARQDLLINFRDGFRRCLHRWGDVLFELTDSLLVGPPAVTSLPALSLEACFSRSHSSLYQALEDGAIDVEHLRDLLVRSREPVPSWVFAIDATVYPHDDADTSPERSSCYHPQRTVVAGWRYQWAAELTLAADSWTAPLDARRIRPGEDATDATVGQIRDLAGRLPPGPAPLFVLDAGYDPIALGHELRDDPVSVLVRLRGDRVFRRRPPAHAAGRMGRPRRHGAEFRCALPLTHGEPDLVHETSDPTYGKVQVRAWRNLHPRLDRRGRWQQRPPGENPIVEGTAINVVVEHLPRTVRRSRGLWLWWSGPGVPDLDLFWRAYLRRFDIEHTFRFAKHILGAVLPAVQQPASADRWTWIEIAALTHIRLARGLVADHRLPWQRPLPIERLTPSRVRRGFAQLVSDLPSLTTSPKPSRAGPGRPKGTRRPPRTRYPVVSKGNKQGCRAA
jgi:hypothetical protein